MAFAFYSMIAVFRGLCGGRVVIISELLNKVKHVKSPLRCLAHSWCSGNTGSLPLEGHVSEAGLALPDVPLGVLGSAEGGVALCLFADCPLSSLSFLIWFLWRRGSLSNSSARAVPVPSSRSAFAILTGCCGDAVTRLGTGAPGLS